MKIAIPIETDNGLDSKVFKYFGMAKEFLVVDLENKTFETTKNQKLADKTASCKAGKFEKGLTINAVITRCIGDGSLRDMHSSGIKVFQAQKETVMGNLELLEKGDLKLFHMFDICQGHKNKKEHGCGHHH
ncbi:MAG: dinitrogenase iron-molybdenum cofactor [Desulfobacteraceae bacterium]|nr:dinitrogenase iron-molybdenum cofactor [Desulfobacteraceae bacterium]